MNAQSPGLIKRAIQLFEQIPYSLIAFLARFSIAAVFWKSGQTKVEGFAIDLISGTFQLGEPRLAASTLPLFRSEYQLGFATRFSALALIGMTLTIQLFVYPDAYPTHGTWLAILLLLVAKGPGCLSIDHLIARRYR